MRVFLAPTSNEANSFRGTLKNVLEKAGIAISESESETPDKETCFEGVSCSINVIGSSYGPLLPNQSVSFQEYFYQIAQEKASESSDFRVFIWQPEDDSLLTDDKQREFLNRLTQSLSSNSIYARACSPIQLVEDIRFYSETSKKTDYKLSDSDIYLVYNELDDSEANEVIEMLSDIVPVDKLSIVQDSEMDYAAYCSQQFSKSKLPVVYFKYSADWALPFTQEIWKKIGGASAHSAIMLIGDEDPDTNLDKKIRAPRIISLITSGELIPLEIKVQYDKIAEAL